MEFVSGVICGAISSNYLIWTIVANLSYRRERHREQELAAQEAELRRDIIEYGRDTEVRPDAGGPSEQSNLFPVIPGAMTLSHIQETGKDD
jgi:hypothetical protein